MKAGAATRTGSCRPCMPYRFVFRIQKAKELAAQTRELGGLLLAAFEKGDSRVPDLRPRAAGARAGAPQPDECARTSGAMPIGRCRRWASRSSACRPAAQYYAEPDRQRPQRRTKTPTSRTWTLDRASATAANVSEGIAEAMDYGARPVRRHRRFRPNPDRHQARRHVPRPSLGCQQHAGGHRDLGVARPDRGRLGPSPAGLGPPGAGPRHPDRANRAADPGRGTPARSDICASSISSNA